MNHITEDDAGLPSGPDKSIRWLNEEISEANFILHSRCTYAHDKRTFFVFSLSRITEVRENLVTESLSSTNQTMRI